jgi:hypothetical protein
MVATGVGVGLATGVGVGAAALTPRPWQPARMVMAKKTRSDASSIFLEAFVQEVISVAYSFAVAATTIQALSKKEQQLYSTPQIHFLGKTLAAGFT